MQRRLRDQGVQSKTGEEVEASSTVQVNFVQNWNLYRTGNRVLKAVEYRMSNYNIL